MIFIYGYFKMVKRIKKYFEVERFGIKYKLYAQYSKNKKIVKIYNSKNKIISRTKTLNLTKSTKKFSKDLTFKENTQRLGRTFRTNTTKRPKDSYQVTITITAVNKKTKEVKQFSASSIKNNWGKDNKTPLRLAKKGAINRLGGNGESKPTEEKEMLKKYNLYYKATYEKYGKFKKGLDL